jgi:hypothetical protein
MLNMLFPLMVSSFVLEFYMLTEWTMDSSSRAKNYTSLVTIIFSCLCSTSRQKLMLHTH